MTQYSKVQFISWELYTGPILSDVKTGYYAGIGAGAAAQDQRLDVASQCQDIQARVAFTADAIRKASAGATSDPSTLKVFMAPEFLYRAAGGAYLHDLLNGWNAHSPYDGLPTPLKGAWGGLFGELKELIASSKYDDWVFVFGTAISASFQTRQTSVQGRQTEEIDVKKPAEGYNSALIQRGGQHPGDVYVTRKHFKSHIDFLEHSMDWQHARIHTHGSIAHPEPEDMRLAEDPAAAEGNAFFTLPGIIDLGGKPLVFGCEICLDHLESFAQGQRNNWGRLRNANQRVKLQLVPSCGASLNPASISLLPQAGKPGGAYAFNCDGGGTLDEHFGSHTMVWRDPAATSHVVCEASSGESSHDTLVLQVASQLAVAGSTIPASSLWDSGQGCAGAGSVRILPAQAL